MDEPTVGLDPASRRDLLDHVLALRDSRAMAILWATHLVDEAEQADRVAVLHRGKVIADGAPAELVAQAGAPDLHDAFVAMTGVADA